MTQYASKDVAFLLLGGYSLLTQTGVLDDQGSEAVIKETTPLGTNWPRMADTGNRRAGLSQEGWFDDAVGSVHDALSGAKLGTSRVLCYGLEGNLKLKHFIGYQGALESKYSRLIQLEDFHRAKASYAGNGATEQGTILHEHAQETAAGNTTAQSHDFSTDTRARQTAITSSSVANPSVITCPAPHGLTTGDRGVIAGHAGSTPSINNEYTVTVTGLNTFTIPVNVTVGGAGGTVTQASTQNGASGYAQVSQLALSGYTNLALKIRHSTDNASFVDLITFTVITAAPAAERLTVAGAINRYTAMAWAYGGAGATPSWTGMVGLTRPETS